MPARVARAWVELCWLQFWLTVAGPPLELVLLPLPSPPLELTLLPPLSPPLEVALLPPLADVPPLEWGQRFVGEVSPELGQGPGLTC